MAAFRELPVKDWTTFVKGTDVLEPESISPLVPSSYIFRGQADATWPLRPSLLRNVAGLAAADVITIERRALEVFRTHAHHHLDWATIQSAPEILSWWSLMQHYGAPTRLLDWTASAYVAAYFAVDREPRSAGAVWAVHVNTVHSHSGLAPTTAPDVNRIFSDPNGEARLFTIRRLVETPRMAAQQTAFTVSPSVLADHGDILAGISEPPGKALFIKLVIEPEIKAEFLRRLRRMNITAQALFPGVDGLGRSVAELVTLAAHHRIRQGGTGATLHPGPAPSPQ
jgi:hypothetical protein